MGSSAPRLAMIWAMSENRVIGRDNALPWRLSADLKYFKAVTMGKPVIMGRRTFESIGRPLPGRTNIIVTRQPDYRAEGIVVVNDVDAAIAEGRLAAEATGADEIMVIGGAEIYALMLNRAQRLYITEISGQFDGDAFFPEFDPEGWLETSREQHGSNEDGQPAHSFVVLNAVG
ncbi:dihydrofolate reductase [Denitrobaculum tricleocarpae]|uniref:Dihydrofolate reductase n=1 Tax=Denitrobaculum tricleocarpae TaxID=2591009 RepID=A0A545T0V5_9PROT|nr:dihydrofolate reductase [Denitrobaculum tricleocarpae]TQV70853.1 dihydrofolate reductase [Denitrobaculum tricleocarpae]